MSLLKPLGSSLILANGKACCVIVPAASSAHRSQPGQICKAPTSFPAQIAATTLPQPTPSNIPGISEHTAAAIDAERYTRDCTWDPMCDGTALTSRLRTAYKDVRRQYPYSRRGGRRRSTIFAERRVFPNVAQAGLFDKQGHNTRSDCAPT
ncbi:hypothetical protein BDW22DRAFT_1422689 [Trametopsis cervina]|nr:hypothetical protein BDW22DRAFT_1422689 [Trametopsis cervina]